MCKRFAILIVFFTVAFQLLDAQAQQVRLYFFTAQSCPPCRQMEPVIERLSQQGFAVTKIDVNAQPNWAQHFKVTQTPQSIIVADNKIYGRQSGIIAYEKLASAMQRTAQIVQKQTPANRQNAIAIRSQKEAGQTNRYVSQTNSKTVNRSTKSAQQLAYQATVRLRVEDPEGISHGTGTVIHVRDNIALVLTCGHIFRDSNGKGTIEVDYGFDDGDPTTGSGQLLFYDWDSRDVALLTVPITHKIQPVELAGESYGLERGDSAFTVGCSHGKTPTVQTCQIKRAAMYGMGDSQIRAKKIDTTVKPVDGRSGGGLFAPDGKLIGVCNAAAVEIDEGIYSALENVYWQLAKTNLAHLFQSQNGQNKTRFAKNADTNSQVGPKSQPAIKSPANSNQLIVTIRSAGDPTNVSTFTIENPSQALLQQLARESGPTRLATRPSDMPDVRGGSTQQNRQFRGQSPK